MNFPQLSNNIQMTHDLLQNNAMCAVNQNITARNWLVGYWIVEFEQKQQIIQSLIGKSQVPENTVFQILSGKLQINENLDNTIFQSMIEKLQVPKILLWNF